MSYGVPIILINGPYDLHVLTCDNNALPEEFRFNDEIAKDIDGKPSICAPKSIPDGRHVYKRNGVNAFGHACYIYVEK